MYTLLSIAKAHHASDLHITVGVRPKCRISGTLYEMDGFERLTPAMTKELVESMFNEKQKKTMEATGEVDFAYTDTRVGRFRVNAFHQRGSYAAVLRIVASDIPTPEDLGVPEAVLGLTKKKRGLVLVTGPTGSGTGEDELHVLETKNKSGFEAYHVPMDSFWNWVKTVAHANKTKADIADCLLYTTDLTEEGITVWADIYDTDMQELGNITVDFVWNEKSLQVTQYTYKMGG